MVKRAVLLANLGSPDNTDVQSVRRYLNQFLMDPYVIQLPWLFRRLLVSLFVLPSRPKDSAEAYKSVWLDEGSPLIVFSNRLQQALQEQVSIPVAMAMRYGKPSIEQQIIKLTEDNDLDELVFIPLYPHFAESTVTTSIEQVKKVITQHKLAIKLTVIPPFYQQQDYIMALVNSAQPFLEQPYDHILFSYHGLPESHITKLDKSGNHCLKNGSCCSQSHQANSTCYHHQVMRTTQCFVRQAGIDKNNYSVAFQSRIGRAKWLQPNTEDTLRELAEKGVKNILVICPAFVTDCLETLEEIAIRGQQVFQQAGGEKLTLIPCLNDHPDWVKVLASWSE
ncbi:MAG: ferrochelatase [Gammaproteobacteria bacterium]|nr:MAG: ferrochelatase [Gammaproteobacteria bacterium]